MDAPNLQENFIDDILSPSNTARKYRLINNADGTISLEDVTVYSQIGSSYGSKELNESNAAINALYDEILSDLETIYNANNNIIQAKKNWKYCFRKNADKYVGHHRTYINNCGELEAYQWILRSPNQKRAIGCKLMAYSTR